jgi:DNA repair protein SbcC/Rad50
MIPLKLAIEGLYSYQQRQEIDFRQLTNSGLFGIFGRVGSGKTSLLEAISFVLYGESERLNSRENRQYNMMNLKSAQMLIDFEFLAGAEQHPYRYTFKAERHPKKHHEVKPGKRQVYRQENGDWIPQPIEKEDIKAFTRSVLGLDYDNFKRTIIIPQNQFREFLELDPKDRTEMMRRLFDLTRFDLAVPVAMLEKANDAALNGVRGQLMGLGEASPETIEAAQADIEAVTAEIDEHDKQLTLLRERAQRLEHLQKRYDEREKAQYELANYIGQQPDFERLRATISDYERCDRAFRAMLEQVAQLTDKQADGQRAATKAKDRLADAQQKLVAAQEAHRTAQAAFDTRDRLTKQIAELDTVLLIITNRYAIEQHTRSLTALRKKAQNQTDLIETKAKKRADGQAVIDNLSGQESNLARLNEVRNWFTAASPLKKEVAGLSGQIEKYDTDLASIKQRKDKALAGFRAGWADLHLKDLPDAIRGEIDALKRTQQSRKAAHETNRLKQTLQQYASALTDGEPCPLCGSAHHPAVHQDSTIDDEATRSERELQGVEQQIDKTNSLLIKAEGLLGEIRSVHNQGKTLINDHADAVARQSAHHDLFVWPEFSRDNEQAVLKAISQEADNQKRLATARTAVQQLTAELEAAERDRAALNAQAAELTGTIGSLQQTVNQQLSELKCFDEATIETFTTATIDDLKADLERQVSRAKTDFEQADSQKVNAEADVAARQTDVLLAQQQQQSWQTDREILEMAIGNALLTHSLTRPALDAILQTNLDVAAERQRVLDFDLALNTAQTKANDLATELADQPFDPADLADSQGALKTAQLAADGLNQRLGETRKAHQELTRQWAEKQTVQQEFDTLTLREKDLDEMSKLFRGQGFVKYVSTVYLNDLCQAANARFTKLTNNQLRLEFSDDNFIIRDFLNGGKTRLAKTLSGGQMFQAALSLALALSDNIQHITQSKQNLFFLDEGFGTLDKESLQTVFETLKSLRKENRVVGIISHVEELQQEIDTYIRAVDNGEGSRIECSWLLQ